MGQTKHMVPVRGLSHITQVYNNGFVNTQRGHKQTHVQYTHVHCVRELVAKNEKPSTDNVQMYM